MTDLELKQFFGCCRLKILVNERHSVKNAHTIQTIDYAYLDVRLKEGTGA